MIARKVIGSAADQMQRRSPIELEGRTSLLDYAIRLTPRLAPPTREFGPIWQYWHSGKANGNSPARRWGKRGSCADCFEPTEALAADSNGTGFVGASFGRLGFRPPVLPVRDPWFLSKYKDLRRGLLRLRRHFYPITG